MLRRLVPSKLAEFVDFSLRSFNETKGYGFIESADTAAIYGKEQHGGGRSRSFEGCRLDDHGNKKTYLTFEVIKQLGFNHGFRAFLADFPWLFLWFSRLFVGVCQALTGALPCQDVFVLKTALQGAFPGDQVPARLGFIMFHGENVGTYRNRWMNFWMNWGYLMTNSDEKPSNFIGVALPFDGLRSTLI
jgi:hypothetical protein